MTIINGYNINYVFSTEKTADQVAPGMYAVRGAYDGVYGFGDYNAFILLNGKQYDLTRVPGVALRSDVVVTDQSLRLHPVIKLGSVFSDSAAAREPKIINANDGVYKEPGLKDPAFVIIGGRTYEAKAHTRQPG